ncbi:hypothetical protein NKG94_08030 [Micromonospora sp. M12]
MADLGRDADLFIVEATDHDGETSRPTRNLMTSTEAGRWARRAGARRLLLTHFWPGTTGRPRGRRAGRVRRCRGGGRGRAHPDARHARQLSS